MFLFQMVFMDTTATIPTGALVGRRIAPDLERAGALPTHGRRVVGSDALPATVQDAPRPRAQVIAPGTRRFRGRAVE